MIKSLTFRTMWSGSLAAALLVASATASAQTPPDQMAPPAEPAPAPAAQGPTVEGESFPHMGKAHEIMIGKDVWFRFGLQAQVWADFQQDSNKAANGDDGGYSNNMFLRRARLIVAAGFLKVANLWFQFDAPRLGQFTAGAAGSQFGNKRFTAADGGGEILQDAWGEIKLAGDAFMLEVGLMVIPFGRNELQSTTTFLTLDIGNTSALVPYTSGTRDVGFELKGYELDDHLEFRAGIFSGGRQSAVAPNPNSNNFFRVTGLLQYDIFDVEKGYVYAGHNFGKKKIVAINAGFDMQANNAPNNHAAYVAFSGALAGSWPLSGEGNPKGGDEISWVLQYYHYDGGNTVPTPTTGLDGSAAIQNQNDFLGELAYYNKDLSLSIFGKFEMQQFADDANKALNTRWFGGGIKYYIYENLANFTLAFNRAQFPDAATSGAGAKNDANEITFQTQLFYY